MKYIKYILLDCNVDKDMKLKIDLIKHRVKLSRNSSALASLGAGSPWT